MDDDVWLDLTEQAGDRRAIGEVERVARAQRREILLKCGEAGGGASGSDEPGQDEGASNSSVLRRR